MPTYKLLILWQFRAVDLLVLDQGVEFELFFEDSCG